MKKFASFANAVEVINNKYGKLGVLTVFKNKTLYKLHKNGACSLNLKRIEVIHQYAMEHGVPEKAGVTA